MNQMKDSKALDPDKFHAEYLKLLNDKELKCQSP